MKNIVLFVSMFLLSFSFNSCSADEEETNNLSRTTIQSNKKKRECVRKIMYSYTCRFSGETGIFAGETQARKYFKYCVGKPNEDPLRYNGVVINVICP
jgi:hypothetical protein